MPDISKWVIWLHTTTYFVGQINEAETMTTVSVFSFCHLVRMILYFFSVVSSYRMFLFIYFLHWFYILHLLSRYTFYDGPPFATGLPHYGHILAGTIKDIVTRFAHQSGFHVDRRFGWDCHGLPVVRLRY